MQKRPRPLTAALGNRGGPAVKEWGRTVGRLGGGREWDGTAWADAHRNPEHGPLRRRNVHIQPPGHGAPFPSLGSRGAAGLRASAPAARPWMRSTRSKSSRPNAGAPPGPLSPCRGIKKKDRWRPGNQHRPMSPRHVTDPSPPFSPSPPIVCVGGLLVGGTPAARA